MGAASGALYGALCEIVPPASAGVAVLFGTVLWITADESGVPARRLSKGPTEFHIRVHAKALVSHLVYGVSTELMRRGLRKPL
jgi:putative membrane protein